MTRATGLSTGFLALALGLSACANTRQLQVASAGSTGCPPTDIEVSQVRSGVGTRSWLARCAGASFQCSSVDDGCTRCAPVRGGRGAASEVSQTELARDEAALRQQGPRFEFSREGEVLRGVRATFSTEPATLLFSFAPAQARDTVHVVITAREGVRLVECAELALVGEGQRVLLSAPLQALQGQPQTPPQTPLRAQLPRAPLIAHTQAEPAPTVHFCGREWPLTRADVYGFERLGEYMDEALTGLAEGAASTAGVTASTSFTTAPVDESVTRVVRAHLDERAALLRGCAGVGADVVLPVEATWDAAGVLALRVSGRDDPAVHECATSVLRERRAPEGSAGRLIHVLAPH